MTTKHLLLRLAGLGAVVVSAALNLDVESLMLVCTACATIAGASMAKHDKTDRDKK